MAKVLSAGARSRDRPAGGGDGLDKGRHGLEVEGGRDRRVLTGSRVRIGVGVFLEKVIDSGNIPSDASFETRPLGGETGVEIGPGHVAAEDAVEAAVRLQVKSELGPGEVQLGRY